MVLALSPSYLGAIEMVRPLVLFIFLLSDSRAAA